MKYIEIKKGDVSSEVLILGHKELATVFLPSVEEPTLITIEGTHDLENFGVIYRDSVPFTLRVSTNYSVHVFNPEDFKGLEIIRFKIERPLPNDYKIWLYLHTN